MRDRRNVIKRFLFWFNPVIFKQHAPPKPLKNEQKKPPAYHVSCMDGGTKHDWQELKSLNAVKMIEGVEGVVKVDPYGQRFTTSKFSVDFKPKPDSLTTMKAVVVVNYWSSQKVCLSCGECIDGIKANQDRVQLQLDAKVSKERTVIERKELAEKLWSACEKGVKV